MAPRSSQGRLLPPLELEILKVLWLLGQGSVREVQTEISRRRPLAYTTVETLLDRLYRKGAAERRKQGRRHIYQPLVSRQIALELALERLAQDFFDGSRERLLAHLQGASPAAAPAAVEVLDAALL